MSKKSNPTLRYCDARHADRYLGPKGYPCLGIETRAEGAEEMVMTRRTEAINTIESDGRYDFATRVMTRRTEAINNIESEGRYAEGATRKSYEYELPDDIRQEDAALTRRPLVVYGSRTASRRGASGASDPCRSFRRTLPQPVLPHCTEKPFCLTL